VRVELRVCHILDVDMLDGFQLDLLDRLSAVLADVRHDALLQK
jgi:hypothetical protein